jgi:hypothetical protein
MLPVCRIIDKRAEVNPEMLRKSDQPAIGAYLVSLIRRKRYPVTEKKKLGPAIFCHAISAAQFNQDAAPASDRNDLQQTAASASRPL